MSNTQLVPVDQRAAVALNSTETERHLVELSQKHRDIVAINDRAGRDQAHGAAMELKRARTAIERVAKDARDDATKFSKAVIAEEKRLISLIQPEEDRLMSVRDAWDAEQERIRAERAAAEQARVAALRARVEEIASIPLTVANKSAADIALAMVELGELAIDESYEEFVPHAEDARTTAGEKLRELHSAALLREEEAARLAAERAEIERVRAEQEARAAELERREREQREAAARAAAEAALAAQRAADEASAQAKREAAEREAYLKQQKDAFEAEKAEAKALLAAQERELAAERKRIADEIEAQRRAEEQARAEQEAKEAAQRAIKDAAERQARERVEFDHAAMVVSTLAQSLGVSTDDATQMVMRAAATLAACRKVAEVA